MFLKECTITPKKNFLVYFYVPRLLYLLSSHTKLRGWNLGTGSSLGWSDSSRTRATAKVGGVKLRKLRGAISVFTSLTNLETAKLRYLSRFPWVLSSRGESVPLGPAVTWPEMNTFSVEDKVQKAKCWGFYRQWMEPLLLDLWFCYNLARGMGMLSFCTTRDHTRTHTHKWVCR